MDAEYQLDIDVHRMCRLCLTVDEKNLKNFFCSDILDGAIVAFPKIFKNVTDIETKKDDKLPQGICCGCKTKISEFHLFKQRCINSNALLCKILDVPIPIPATVTIEKPSQVDKATQSTERSIHTRSTQTIEVEQSNQLIEYVDREVDQKSAAKLIETHLVKHETDEDIEDYEEQEMEEVEGYVFEYECPEYLRVDATDTVSDIAEGNEDVLDEKHQYKVEKLETLETVEMYSIVERFKPTTSKRSKGTTECNICKVNVASRVANSHRNLHQQTLPIILDSIPYFRCGRCKTVFVEIAQMENHFLNGSCCSDADEPNCTDYQYLDDFPGDTEEGGPFSGCRTLRLSSVIQTSDDTFSCELCYSFSSSNVHDILIHCATHFSNDKENNVVYYDEMMPGAHRCGVCRLNHSSLSAALRHVFFHSTTFICPLMDCDEKFAEFKHLNVHIEQLHMAKENVKHQRCMHCGEISKSYEAFRQHQRKECTKKVYRCDVCEKKFFHKSSLNMHMKYHSAARYKCEVCDKTFSQSCDYKVHYRIHSGEKPYKCEHCDKSFRSISNRKDHMSTHRTDKMFTCEICNQTFKSERTLRGHYPIHNPTKKFQCDQCEKSFHRRFHLTLHLKGHNKKDYRLVSATTVIA